MSKRAQVIKLSLNLSQCMKQQTSAIMRMYLTMIKATIQLMNKIKDIKKRKCMWKVM